MLNETARPMALDSHLDVVLHRRKIPRIKSFWVVASPLEYSVKSGTDAFDIVVANLCFDVEEKTDLCNS